MPQTSWFARIVFSLLVAASAIPLARAAGQGGLSIRLAALVDDTQAFFVDTVTGNDGNAGTMAAPFKTIGAGVTAANASGSKKRVLVSKGTYNQAVTLPNGVSLYGGFDAAAGWSRAAANTTTIAATPAASQIYPLTISSCSAGCFVDGFTISAGNAGAGLNSVAVFVLNSAGARISNNTIVAGNGGAGVQGGPTPATPAGGNGQVGVPGSQSSTSGGAGGAGGTSSCGAPGGAGGGGGYSSSSGGAGTIGGGSGTGGGGGAPGVASGQCFVKSGSGGPGTAGGSGSQGVGGVPGVSGTITASGWVAGAGGNGGAGTAGRGGGGGQQPLPGAIITSQPCRFRSRIVARLISGANTCCAQPASSATRMRRSPSAGNTSIQ
jgi:hypothetical protein